MKSGRAILWLALIPLLFAPPLEAKKKDQGLKKVIAIGHVDAGSMYLPNLGSGGLNDLFKDLLKKKLEETGRYIVVLPRKEVREQETPQIPTQMPEPSPGGSYSAADAAKLMEQAQLMLQQFSLPMAGERTGDFPVAAQALFRLTVRTGESQTDTGGAVGMAEVFTGSDLGVADFSSEKQTITMTGTEHDPEKGNLIDHYRTKASAVRFNRLAGMTHYSYSSYDEFEQALDKNAKSALGKIAKWIDKKMQGTPWEGQIFKKEGAKVFLNVGASAGIKNGMSFTVFKRAAVAGLGVEFGAEEQGVGRLEIVDTKENYAIGNISAGEADVGLIVHPIVHNREP